MSKLIINRPQYDLSKTRAQNYADWINQHWKVNVVAAQPDGRLTSRLHNGVPRCARDANYKHEDIVWVYREGKKWIIRKG